MLFHKTIIGQFPNICLTLGKIPNIIKEFHNIAQKTKLFLRFMNCYDICDSILNGILDLGIFYEDVGGLNSNIISHNIGCYKITLYTFSIYHQ